MSTTDEAVEAAACAIYGLSRSAANPQDGFSDEYLTWDKASASRRAQCYAMARAALEAAAIPEAAVEAAAEAIGEFNAHAIGGQPVPIKDLSGLDREHALGEARAALEAAAPYMLGPTP